MSYAKPKYTNVAWPQVQGSLVVEGMYSIHHDSALARSSSATSSRLGGLNKSLTGEGLVTWGHTICNQKTRKLSSGYNLTA